MPESYFCHFTSLQFSEAYWQQPAAGRQAALQALAAELQAGAPAFAIYQVFPTRGETDLLLWSSFLVSTPEQPAEILGRLGRMLNAWRALLRPTQTYWGFSRPSDYSKGKSSQEIDPFAPERKKYLVVYPFSKTSEWYQLGRDARQGMMNEHIRIGHQYPQITQLLLYSTGLQDQEFIVAYETDDLAHFSGLVAELRATDGRPFTLRDTPIYTGIHGAPPDILALFA